MASSFSSKKPNAVGYAASRYPERPRLDEEIRSFHALVMDRARHGPGPLPNLVGVGAGRSGTTTLFGLLQSSADVHVSPVKEVNFFGINQHPFHKNGILLSEYRYYFQSWSGERYIADITPVYLTFPTSLEMIERNLESPKIVITLREPISRCLSQYKHHYINHGISDVNKYFRQALTRYSSEVQNSRNWYAPEKNLSQSMYSNAVSTCFRRFGRDNCLILFYEDLERDLSFWAQSLERFLGVSITRDIGSRYQNASEKKRLRLDAALLTELQRLFRPEIDRLSDLLDKDLLSFWATERGAG